MNNNLGTAKDSTPGSTSAPGRIGVLMGGASTEREISLKSGKAVYEALLLAGYDVIAIDLIEESRESVSATLGKAKVGVVFIAMHGRFGEDGTLQQILESLSIAYTGSDVAASRLAMDKIASREVFKQHNIPVPKYKVFNKNSVCPNINYQLSTINYQLNYPLVVKPASHGSSIGLSVVEEENGLPEAMELAYKYDQRIIVEEYIKGKEVTVGILQERPLPVIQIIPKDGGIFDYHAKYKPGMTEYVVPAKIQERKYRQIQEFGLKAHIALGCRSFSRVDMIFSEEGIPVVLEVNTIPGLTSTSLLPKAAGAIGISFTDLCVRILEETFKRCLEIKEEKKVLG
jgi:D-alanine-D-alanine ligase